MIKSMKKTNKTAAIKKPHNYWINRRVWENEEIEYVKINGIFLQIDWLIERGWEVHTTF